ESATTSGGFRIAKHDADLLADLVDEDQARARLGNRASQFTERLGHQAGLQSHVAVAHFALKFGFWHQRRNGVDDEHVDRAGAHEAFGNFQRLLAVIGLRDEEVIDIYAESFRVSRIESMFGVDEGRHAADLLCFGDYLQRYSRLTGRLRAKDF